jgi:hypothetical protein
MLRRGPCLDDIILARHQSPVSQQGLFLDIKKVILAVYDQIHLLKRDLELLDAPSMIRFTLTQNSDKAVVERVFARELFFN